MVWLILWLILSSFSVAVLFWLDWRLSMVEKPATDILPISGLATWEKCWLRIALAFVSCSLAGGWYFFMKSYGDLRVIQDQMSSPISGLVSLNSGKASKKELENLRAASKKELENLRAASKKDVEDLRKKLRLLREDMLKQYQHDGKILEFVYMAHGDSVTRETIRREQGQIDSDIRNLEDALKNDLSQVPTEFTPAVGIIEEYNPSSFVLKIRTSGGALVEGNVDPTEAATVKLIARDIITEVALDKKHKGWIIEAVARIGTNSLHPIRLYKISE